MSFVTETLFSSDSTFDYLSLCTPVWGKKIERIDNEFLTFVEDDNYIKSAPLLYTPNSIISVTNAQKTKTYTKGKDYTVNGNVITLTDDTDIPFFTKEEFYPSQPAQGKTFATEDGNLLFREGSFFHERQICVTYIPSGPFINVDIPSAIQKLPVISKKLKEGKTLNLTVFGDSISVGANASGYTDISPFTPPYSMLFTGALCQKYHSTINYKNYSKGGEASAWGVEKVPEVAKSKPDLAIIAFGGNDSLTEPSVFIDNISKIVKIIKSENSDCEFVLIATSTPNPLLWTDKAKFFGNQQYFHEVLSDYADNNSSVIMANITKMQEKIMTAKRYVDLTANNVNHPNDFFHRLHAAYLLEMFN